MRLTIGKINNDFVGPGINLEGNATFAGKLLFGQRITERLGHSQLQFGDLGSPEVGAASDLPDESA